MTMDSLEAVALAAKAMAENAGFNWDHCYQDQWIRDAQACVSSYLASLEAQGMVVVPRGMIRDKAGDYELQKLGDLK